MENNNKKQRLHVQSSTEASELNLSPGLWPETIKYQSHSFKKILKKVNIQGEIVWCDYTSNTEEQHWTLRVYND